MDDAGDITKYIKRFFSVILIMVVIFGIFYLYLPLSGGIIQTMNNTVGKEKVDVMCVGSSHLYIGINPLQMYEENGIAAYDLAIGSQAPWQSYYYIKEAHKSQKPQLLLFDVYMVGSSQEVDNYQDYQTAANLVDFPFGINKIKAVSASKADSRLNILLSFPYNYDEIDSYMGFSINKHQSVDRLMGYGFRRGVVPYDKVADVSSVTESLPLDPKNEKYLRLIIEYCRDNDVELLLTNTPWPCITEEVQMYFNRIQEIADEYSVPFLNGCLYYEDMGIDYIVDSSGDGGHLNHSGVTKYTRWLGTYIADNYSLPDRRNDSDYEVYGEGMRELLEMVEEEE